MSDGYTSNNILFCTMLSYIFGNDALIQIEVAEGKASLTYDVPSLDAEAYLDEYNRGTLAVADAKALFDTYTRVVGLLRTMRGKNQPSWRSRAFESAWVNGAWPDGRRIK